MANIPSFNELISRRDSIKSPSFTAPKFTIPSLSAPKPSPIVPQIKTPKITPPVIPQEKGWDAMSAWDKTKAFLKEIPSGTWQLGKDIASGFTGATSAMLSGGEWASKKVGAPTAISDIFKVTGDKTNEWAKELAPHNPIFIDKLYSGIGSAATFFVPGLIVGRGALGAGALLSRVALFSKVSPKVASALLGNTVMTGLESMAEAGSVYKEKLAQGADEKDASDAATKTAVANAALIFLTNKFGLFSGSQRGIIKSVLISAPTEGFQEFMQEAISNVNTGKNWSENALESGIIGALIGGPMGLLSATALPREQAQIPMVKTQLPKEPAEAREWIANNAQQNIIRYSESKQPEAVTRTATTMQPTISYQPEVKPFDLGSLAQRVNYYATTKPEGAEYISETKPKVQPIEQADALKKSLKVYQDNLVAQVARYSKDSADIIKNLDLKNVSSLDEAVNMTKASLPKDIVSAPAISESIENWKKSAEQVREAELEKAKPVDEGRFLVYDENKVILNKIKNVSKQIDGKIETVAGEGEFIGGETRAEGLRSYKKIIEESKILPDSRLSETKIKPATTEKVSEAGFVVPTPKAKEITTAIKGAVRVAKKAKPTKVSPASIDRLIKPKAPLISRPEDVLLRNKLKAMVRSSKYGYRAGKTDTRLQIYEKLQTKMAEAKEVKKQIINYVEKNIPLKKRGLFIKRVVNAKTQNDRIKVFIGIDHAIYNFRKSTAIKELNNKLEEIEKSKKISVDYKPIIQSLIKDIELKGHTAKKIKELEGTRNFIKRELEKGNDVTMPEYVLESLKILDRKPIKDLTLPEIAVINGKIDVLIKAGETKLSSKESIEEMEKKMKSEELIKGTVGIEKNPLIVKHGIGERLTVLEKVKNAYFISRNEAQRIDLSTTPIDVFMDMMDGNKNYTGANYTIIKKTTDMNFGNYLDFKDLHSTEAWDKARELEMEDVNFERIGVHAVRNQKDGMNKLTATGITEEDINNVVLTKQETSMYNFFRKNLDDFGPLIEKVMQNVYNQKFTKVKNYFSYLSDFNAMSDMEVWERMGTPLEFGHAKKNIKPGLVEERTGGKQKIKLNAMEIYLNHIDNVGYLLNMARDNKMLGEIVNSKEYGEVAGDLGQKMMSEWIDLIARKGGRIGDQQIKILDILRRNIGVGTLGLKLSSTLIQPTALFDGAGFIGTYAFKGLSNIALSKEWRMFLKDNFAELRNRGADDPAYTEFSDIKALAKIQEMGYKPLKKLDVITASAVTSGAYEKYMADHKLPVDFSKPNKEAISYAELILRRTQSSAIFKDIPMSISKGAFSGNRSFDKAIFQFQNFVLNRWSYIRHDLWRLGIQEKDPKKAATILFWMIAATLAGIGLRDLSKKILGTERAEQVAINDKVTREFLSTIPFVSQAQSMMIYGGDPFPSADILRQAFVTVPSQITAKTPETRQKGYIRLLEVIGKAGGIPGSAQTSELLRSKIGTATKKTLPGMKTSATAKKKLPGMK